MISCLQGLGRHTHAFQYPQQSHAQHPSMHDHLDPNQAPMYPYPPAQQPQAYMDPYYAPHQNSNQGMDGYMGMPMNPHPNGPQMGGPNHGGFGAPGQAVKGSRLYPQAPRPYMDVTPIMGGLHHGNPYQREQQRLQTMQRFHSQQLSQQQHYQNQRQQPHQQQHHHQAQRQQSGPAPAGVLPSTLSFAGLTSSICWSQVLHLLVSTVHLLVSTPPFAGLNYSVCWSQLFCLLVSTLPFAGLTQQACMQTPCAASKRCLGCYSYPQLFHLLG